PAGPDPAAAARVPARRTARTRAAADLLPVLLRAAAAARPAALRAAARPAPLLGALVSSAAEPDQHLAGDRGQHRFFADQLRRPVCDRRLDGVPVRAHASPAGGRGAGLGSVALDVRTLLARRVRTLGGVLGHR